MHPHTHTYGLLELGLQLPEEPDMHDWKQISTVYVTYYLLLSAQIKHNFYRNF